MILNPTGQAKITSIKGWQNNTAKGLEVFYNGTSNGSGKANGNF